LLAASCALISSCGDKKAGGDNAGGKAKLVVGFSQIGAESGWRTANTDSIKAEAAKRGLAQLLTRNKNRRIKSSVVPFIAQKWMSSFSPVVTGWSRSCAKSTGRHSGYSYGLAVDVTDDSLYVAHRGDFIEEAAGRPMRRLSGGTATIVELQGRPIRAIDRKRDSRKCSPNIPA
jgi:hypothetical protein